MCGETRESVTIWSLLGPGRDVLCCWLEERYDDRQGLMPLGIKIYPWQERLWKLAALGQPLTFIKGRKG